jgi:ribosomal protein S18 acetylase RimI-like enzyme
MATIAVEPDLATVRRLEAVSFRAWPAASVRFDGAWQIRLTAGHPSRRLNSVNPLDPSDHRNIEARVSNAVRLFDAYGRPAVFRLSPLSPAVLDDYLAANDWEEAGETLVMAASMESIDLSDALDQLPLHDVGRYVDASLALQDADPGRKAGLSEVLNAIRPSKGMFVAEDAVRSPLSALLCVHDNDLAGLFDVATRPDDRRRGHARSLIKSALRWARLRGARRAFLQVEAINDPAVSLYRSLGFQEVYRYVYRQRSHG